jgi:hypothetical protein
MILKTPHFISLSLSASKFLIKTGVIFFGFGGIRLAMGSCGGRVTG